MSDYSDLIPRRRGRTLLIVEGDHEKNDLFWLIFKCFPELQIDNDDVWIYGTNVYKLHDDLVKEYDTNWYDTDVDLAYLVSKKKHPDHICWKDDFTNIFLVFDYERHDFCFSEDVITRMQEYFSDSADAGQLYLNYPMIESYQDMPGYPEDFHTFMNHMVPVTLRPGSRYKHTVKNSVIANNVEFPQKIKDTLGNRYGLQTEEESRQCMIQILSNDNAAILIDNIKRILLTVLTEKEALTAANQFSRVILNHGYITDSITFWTYMRNEFKKIIRAHICKADRVVSDDDSTDNYETRYRNIDYQQILEIQNQVSRDDATGFIWVLNTSILLVPDYNLKLITD